MIADAELKEQLKEFAADCFERCQKRRVFMGEVLGIDFPEEVLPLSIPARFCRVFSGAEYCFIRP